MKSNNKSLYRVRYSRAYLKHLCEELLFGIRVGRNNIIVNEEGLNELKMYLNSSYEKRKNVNNDELSDLEVSLNWLASLMVTYLEGNNVGDLTSPLLNAELCLVESDVYKPRYRFEFRNFIAGESMYFKVKGSTVNFSNHLKK